MLPYLVVNIYTAITTMKIAVYCSSKENISPIYSEAAQIIGQWIGNHHATLIYGGMDLGLMKIIANEVKHNGGKTVGVIPVTRKSGRNILNDENIIVDDLNQRKAKMMMLANHFVVLPGGYGTLDEFISTFTSLSFAGNKSKKIILLNLNGLFDLTLAQLKLFVDNNLLDPKHMQHIKVVTSIQECCNILDQLNNHK